MSVPSKTDRAAGRLVEAQDRPADRRLAAARLADEAERLAALDRQRDAVDRLHVADVAVHDDPAPDREPDLNLDEGCRRHLGRAAGRRCGRLNAALATERAARCHSSAGTGLKQRDVVAGLDLLERRHLLARLLDLVAAARRERALRRRAEHVARRARDRHAASGAGRRRAAARSGAGRACTGGAAARTACVGAAGLDEHAGVHDVDALAHAGDDAEVVRDHDQRRVALGDEALQQLEDLRLDRHVERGRRLVGDQQLRLAGERHRDHRPLAHPARELVRVVLQPQLRARDPDLVEQLGRALVGLLAVHAEVRLERLADLPADRQHRVERGHRVLEDHRDLAAADRAQLLVVQREQVAAVEHRRAARDAAVAREDPEQRERGDALAAARLADDPERLARRDVERDPVDRVDEPALGAEVDVQVVDDEEGLSSHGLCSFGSSASRRPSPIRLKPSTEMMIATPGMIARCGAVWR